MSKRIMSLLLTSVMLFSLTSCQKVNYAEMSLTEYLETVHLPRKFTVSMDPKTVEARETVKVYENVPFIDFDEQTLKKLFLKNPVSTEELTAAGMQYTAVTDTQTESLSVYDGGKAFEKNQPSQNTEEILEESPLQEGEDTSQEEQAILSPNGGFTYRFKPNQSGFSAWMLSTSRYPFLYHYKSDSTAADFLSGLFDSAEKELDFASREKIAENAITLFQDAGVEKVEIDEIAAYDVTALETAQQQGVAWMGFEFPEILESEEVLNAIQVQKSDEIYQVFCRQLIDGIPINSYDTNGSEEGLAASANMNLQYTEKGIVGGSVSNLLQQPISGTVREILSPAEALECARKHYCKGFMLRSYNVEAMELVYIAFYNEDGTAVSLRPYWLIKTSYPQQYYSINWRKEVLEGKLKTYDFNYFDAVTGEIFAGSTSGEPCS